MFFDYGGLGEAISRNDCCEKLELSLSSKGSPASPLSSLSTPVRF